MKLSVLIIAKNEEKMIKECIKSVLFADEIVVIDSGSSDNTATIAKTSGARVIRHKQEDFSKQRMFAKEQAKHEWVLYVDADERVTKELAEDIKHAIESKTHSAYRISRVNYYLGNHKWPQRECLERLFLKKSLIRWKGAVHETPEYTGSLGTLSSHIVHFTHRDLSSMIDKTLSWAQHDVDAMLEIDHPQMTWYRFFRVMATKFFDSYIVKQGWRAGTAGLVESIYQSYSYFIIYSMLWEQQQKQNQKT